MNTSGCFKMMGLGFGAVSAGGLIYLIINDELARYLIMGFAMFLLGAIIVGFFLVYQNRNMMQSLFSQPRHEKSTTYNFPSPPDYPAMWDAQRPEYPALSPAPPGWSNDKGPRQDDNDFMA
jgi:hypothetical protein